MSRRETKGEGREQEGKHDKKHKEKQQDGLNAASGKYEATMKRLMLTPDTFNAYMCMHIYSRQILHGGSPHIDETRPGAL